MISSIQSSVTDLLAVKWYKRRKTTEVEVRRDEPKVNPAKPNPVNAGTKEADWRRRVKQCNSV